VDGKLGHRLVHHLTFVVELFSLMTLQNYSCSDDSIFETPKKTLHRNCFWKLTLTKQTHLTVTKTLLLTWTLTPTENMTKTLLPQVGATGHLEFWWCPSFQWRSQWSEDTRILHHLPFFSSFALQ
jgi:hypothetical protein